MVIKCLSVILLGHLVWLSPETRQLPHDLMSHGFSNQYADRLTSEDRNTGDIPIIGHFFTLLQQILFYFGRLLLLIRSQFETSNEGAPVEQFRDARPRNEGTNNAKDRALESASMEATKLLSALNQRYIHHKCEDVDFSVLNEDEAYDFVENHLKEVPPPLPTPRTNVRNTLSRQRRMVMSDAPEGPVGLQAQDKRSKADLRKRRMKVSCF